MEEFRTILLRESKMHVGSQSTASFFRVKYNVSRWVVKPTEDELMKCLHPTTLHHYLGNFRLIHKLNAESNLVYAERSLYTPRFICQFSELLHRLVQKSNWKTLPLMCIPSNYGHFKIYTSTHTHRHTTHTSNLLFNKVWKLLCLWASN